MSGVITFVDKINIGWLNTFIQMYKKSKRLSTSTARQVKKSGKIRPLICYAVVKKNARKFSAKEIYVDSDIRIRPDEKIVKSILSEYK